MHEWFERAAEQGDLIGAFNYAVCLAEGVGVPRNDERAAFWLKRAAEGVVTAQYWYGRMLAEGRGVAKDDAEAAVWFARAAEAGMAEAQVALAELHVNGRGVPRDHQLARSWFLRAIPAMHAGAMFALGALYGGGHDIEIDREEARRWFAQAAEHGHPIAALMLVEERKFWKQYRKAYEACLSETSTRDAPWYVVPADDKENARLIVSRIVLETLGGTRNDFPNNEYRAPAGIAVDPRAAREMRSEGGNDVYRHPDTDGRVGTRREGRPARQAS